MITENILQGQLVCLTVEDPQVFGDAFSRWMHNSELDRLLNSAPALPFSPKKIAAWLEKDNEKDFPDTYLFLIRALSDGRLIGFIELNGVQWRNGDCFVGIGLGEEQDWGKGYGADAMQVIMRYAFTEFNLRRLTLNVFEYNPRAIRSYEKVGFRHEGRLRQYLHRDGRRYDLIYMGILRDEWLPFHDSSRAS
jgi:RimJ/RimL family protein N-acetyltransferase